MAEDEKTCPRCREQVKLLASLCKHCGYVFSEAEMQEARRIDAGRHQPQWGCIALVGVVLLLAYCGRSDSDDDKQQNEPTKTESAQVVESDTGKYGDVGKQYAWISEGKRQIQAVLKDPSSADFRNVRFYSGGGIPVTCGEVNAKNGFGGYTGFERFVAAGSQIAVTESMVTDSLDPVWDKFCVKGPGDQAYSD